MPKFSVIMPVYNVEEFLRASLDSVINQTLKDIEIICVDDGSTDNSLQILQEYAQQDSRIKILTQPNQGQGCARNRALEAASGDYIAYVDSDDLLLEDALEKLDKCLTENNAEVVVFDFIEYNQYSGCQKYENFAKKLQKYYHFNILKKKFYTWNDLKKHCLIRLTDAAWHKVYSRQFLLNNNIRFNKNRYNEDDIFSQQVLLCAPRIYYLNEYLYLYRVRANSSVNRITKERFKIVENIEQSQKLIKDLGLKEELCKEFSEYKVQEFVSAYLRIPEDLQRKFIDEVSSYLSEKEQRIFQKHIKTNRTFWENIFSLKNINQGGQKVKVLTFMGFQYQMVKKKRVGV